MGRAEAFHKRPHETQPPPLPAHSHRIYIITHVPPHTHTQAICCICIGKCAYRHEHTAIKRAHTPVRLPKHLVSTPTQGKKSLSQFTTNKGFILFGFLFFTGVRGDFSARPRTLTMSCTYLSTCTCCVSSGGRRCTRNPNPCHGSQG